MHHPMMNPEPVRDFNVREVEQPLPLVVEIMPGQASEGLIDIYESGSYESLSLRKLCEKTLSKRNWSIEERQIVDDIRRQLHGGKLLCRGQEVDGNALEYAVLEHTEAGERYLYASVRAIKPQEGGILGRTGRWKNQLCFGYSNLISKF